MLQMPQPAGSSLDYASLAKRSTSDQLSAFTLGHKSCGNYMRVVGQRYSHDIQLYNQLVSSNCIKNPLIIDLGFDGPN